MKHIYNFIGILIVAAIISGFVRLWVHGDDNTSNEYKVSIIDEHEVRLTSEGRTVTLLLENSSSLKDEQIIIIK